LNVKKYRAFIEILLQNYANLWTPAKTRGKKQKKAVDFFSIDAKKRALPCGELKRE
jgi:hypothetical protein